MLYCSDDGTKGNTDNLPSGRVNQGNYIVGYRVEDRKEFVL